MDSLIFALNAVLPIILMVTVGYLLKKRGLMNESFSKAANKLVFHLFLPTMLFLNVYKIQTLSGMGFGYVLYVLAALLVIFLCSIPAVLCIAKKRERRGALLQAAFRSNYALIGIPLAESLFGQEGAMIATLLSAVVIPALIAFQTVGFGAGFWAMYFYQAATIGAGQILACYGLGMIVLSVVERVAPRLKRR